MELAFVESEKPTFVNKNIKKRIDLRFKMKRLIPIAVAIFASAILTLYRASIRLRSIPPIDQPEIPLLHDQQETVMEGFETFLERLKLERGEEDPVVSSTGREKRRYSAKSIQTNLADGSLSPKGRVWHLDHNELTDGRADPRSTMTIDSSTLKILERSGRFEITGLIEPKR